MLQGPLLLARHFVTAVCCALPSALSVTAAYNAAGGEDDHHPLRLATSDRHARIAFSDACARVVMHLLGLYKACNNGLIHCELFVIRFSNHVHIQYINRKLTQ